MQIGYLAATDGNNGTYFGGDLQLFDDLVTVAMGNNPLKGQYDGAADFEFRLPRRNWVGAGNASNKESKRTGMEYVKGAIVQQGHGTTYVNLYAVFEGEDKKQKLVGYNVHYTGDSQANAKRRAGNSQTMRSGPPAGAGNPLGNDRIPY